MAKKSVYDVHAHGLALSPLKMGIGGPGWSVGWMSLLSNDTQVSKKVMPDGTTVTYDENGRILNADK